MNNKLCSSRINFLFRHSGKICKETYSRSKSNDLQGTLRKILLIRTQRALYRSVNIQIRDTQRSQLFLEHLTIMNRKPCFNSEYEVHCMGVVLLVSIKPSTDQVQSVLRVIREYHVKTHLREKGLL
jgi:hypothetical protein